MRSKTQRLLAIKNIITTQKIANQEELLHELEKIGFNYTQATLSRDLRFLKIVKIADEEKGYVYKIHDYIHEKFEDEEEVLTAYGFKSIEFTDTLAVIKTVPGYASSIASRIDYASPFEILGTIAGDDTILIIPREGVGRNDVINALVLIMPDIKNKL